MAKKRQRRSSKRQLFCRKNLPILSATAIFCAGIMAGATALNQLYNQHLSKVAEARAAHFSAQQASEHKRRQQQALQRQQEKTKQHNAKATQRIQAIKKEQATQQLAEPLGRKTPVSGNHPKKTNFSSYTPSSSSRIIAIVIDDIGYKRHEGERTLALPGKVTVAVLPFTPFAHTFAQQAPRQGKEVMLHAPMEPKNFNAWGEGLTANMPEKALRALFNNMINDIPNLVGINNHMGSGLTENAQIMSWLMEELPARGLYFIDSRTTAASAAFEAANKLGIPTYQRDVFLDNNREPNAISQQFDKLVHAAQTNGMALGIGHPYPETLSLLEKRLPELQQQGIELVTVSELLNAQARRIQLALQANEKKRSNIN
ncbi:MAG TPA: divergent polysaccharide deacetylase family protein [Marinagarivorans sp.]